MNRKQNLQKEKKKSIVFRAGFRRKVWLGKKRKERQMNKFRWEWTNLSNLISGNSGWVNFTSEANCNFSVTADVFHNLRLNIYKASWPCSCHQWKSDRSDLIFVIWDTQLHKNEIGIIFYYLWIVRTGYIDIQLKNGWFLLGIFIGILPLWRRIQE